ncbi:MAG: hypothetical protein QXO70_03610 [Candidatus Pacearchaeota archaeon]
MEFTWSLLILVLGALLVLIGQVFVKKPSTRKNLTWIGIVAVVIPILAMTVLSTSLAFMNTPVGGSKLPSFTITPSGATQAPTGEFYCPTTPSVTWSAIDKYGTTVVSGTAYYKQNGMKAITSSPGINKGTEYTYWVYNNTWYVIPKVQVGDCGSNIFQADAIQNASATITGYDLINRQSIDSGAYNTSLGANVVANEEISYQGTAKAGFMPFGGVMVVEYNSTISSVTATGDSLIENPFHVTYTPHHTTHTYKVFGIAPSIDDGSGIVKRIQVQFKNGGSAVGAGSAYYITFIPANYYVTNAGDIVLDVEKFLNDDTSRTGLGSITKVYYWS